MTKTINILNPSVVGILTELERLNFIHMSSDEPAPEVSAPLSAYSDNEEARIEAAVKRYQQGGASVAGAANLFGLDRFDFEKILFERNIPIPQQTIEEVMADAEKIERIRKKEAVCLS